MTSRDDHLGILDWGIGGFDFYRKLREAGVRAPVTYVSDTGYAPYGKVEASALAARVQQVVNFLLDQGAGTVVIACNAASTIFTSLHAPGDVALIEIIGPTLARLRQIGAREVAVLGGERTIASGCYHKPLTAGGVTVHGVVAQPLSALVEVGELVGPHVQAAIADVSRGLRGVQTLVPACTHYLALLPALQAAIMPHQIVDPATEALRSLLSGRFTPKNEGAGTLTCWTTGDPAATQRGAQRAFGVSVANVARLRL